MWKDKLHDFWNGLTSPKKVFVVLGLLVVLILLTGKAMAQDARCGPRDQWVQVLGESYGETRQGVGLLGASMMELFANLDTGTWTILITAPGQATCAVADGQNYEAVTEDLEPAGLRL